MKIQYKEFPGKVVSWDDATLTITHFISTETQDSGGDVMMADGMVVRGKAVVLFQHGQDPVFGNEPIAKPLKFEAGVFEGKKGILATTKYFDDRKLTIPTCVGQRLYEKAKDDTMPNWSIGFNSTKEHPCKGGRVVDEWELHEYSQVAVGMNKEATTLAMKGIDPLPNVDFSKVKFIVVKDEPKDEQPEGFKDMKEFQEKTEEITYEAGAETECLDGVCKMLDGKPFPSEHSCRLLPPVADAKTRRSNGAQEHEGKKYDVIYQLQKGKWVQQAYRYPKENWTAEQASAHCKSHDGSFAAATSGKGGPGSGPHPGGGRYEGEHQPKIGDRVSVSGDSDVGIAGHEGHVTATHETEPKLPKGTVVVRDEEGNEEEVSVGHLTHMGKSTKEIKSGKKTHELAHKGIHAFHKEMMDDLKRNAKSDDLMDRGVETCAKEALEDFADGAGPHVEKYIKAVREMGKDDVLPAMEGTEEPERKGGPGSGRHPSGSGGSNTIKSHYTNNSDKFQIVGTGKGEHNTEVISEHASQAEAQEALDKLNPEKTGHASIYLVKPGETIHGTLQKPSPAPSDEVGPSLFGHFNKDYSAPHRMLHKIRDDMIKAIHAHKGDKSVVPSEAAKVILTKHHEDALPHAKEFIKSWRESHSTEHKPEADPAAPAEKVLKLKQPQEPAKKTFRLSTKAAPEPAITPELVKTIVADAMKDWTDSFRAELRRLSGKVTS